ncbi:MULTISPECIES: acyl-CoA dehydrogenase family protein [unclassified Paenibacillus]|uniref:acyl-CoA dehydrogenase family protein n=1 Tax=unclassified Paenibacillus TaxID=185978 RepID=UPI003641162C
MTLKSTEIYIELAEQLSQRLAETAVERDRQGGTAIREREWIRESGLLKLLIPKKNGGHGETWITVLKIVRRLAEVDSSVAHLFGFHHLNLISPHIYGDQGQKEFYYTETARHNWFWGNAFNPSVSDVKAIRQDIGFIINGTKGFCSGASDSDILIVSAEREDGGTMFKAVIPTNRMGILIHNDWDSFGQRQTDSGRVTFNQVEVGEGELLLKHDPQNYFMKLRGTLPKLILGHLYMGIAEGAFKEVKNYTNSLTRMWHASGARAAEDPYNLRHFGDYWVQLTAAKLLSDRAAERFQDAWDMEADLQEGQYGETVEAILTANAMATKVGLEISSRMFEVMGARSTASQYGFDRYWRNLRTHTLHDPYDYKLKELGHWALNGYFKADARLDK